MAQMPKRLSEYLNELEANKDSRPDQVKEGIETYIGLWQRAIEKGIVLPEDEIDAALAKVEEGGGLYKVAED